MPNLFVLGTPADKVPNTTVLFDVYFSMFNRMINDPWRVKAAANGTDAAYWEDGEEDLDALEYQLLERTDGSLTALERCEIDAALSAIHDFRQRRAWATWEHGT